MIQPNEGSTEDMEQVGTASVSADEYTREAVRFFLEHAAHVTPPGPLESAISLARAEREMNARRWTVRWSDDDVPWDGDVPAPDRLEVAALFTEDGAEYDRGVPLASLGSIADATPEYRRVIAAELAAEALAALGAADTCEMSGGGECTATAEWLVANAGQTCTLHLLPMIDFAHDFIADENPDIPEDRITVLVRRRPCAPFIGGESRLAAR